MTSTAKPRVPAGLSARGRGARLWRDVVGLYSLRIDELVVLEEAARHLDLCDKMRAEVSKAALVVAGSKGQKAPHPLLQELRASRHLVAQLLRQIGLPDEPGSITAAARERDVTWSKRSAARARWS